MKNFSVRKLTQTSLFLALLIVLQYITSSMGQFVTGSAVNLVLILTTLISGGWSGFFVALISPFIARIFGIGPQLVQIVPAIALGNIAFVMAYSILHKRLSLKYLKWCVSIVFSAFLKYLVLWLAVTKLILPLININPQLMAKLSAMFGLNQFITALIGGILAMIIVPLVKKATDKIV